MRTDAAALRANGRDPTLTWIGHASFLIQLAGVNVLDLGAFYAGPFASRLLADLGADVIKLEPVAGDQLRGMSRPFRSAQAGKRSIAVDLKDPELGPATHKLIEWADIVHHNLRPGAAERLGLGYEQVSALNPGVIYVYAPGWGSSGPAVSAGLSVISARRAKKGF